MLVDNIGDIIGILFYLDLLQVSRTFLKTEKNGFPEEKKMITYVFDCVARDANQ